MKELLARRDLEALLIVATSSRDPDVAPFVGPVHLGECLVVVPRDDLPRLGYLTDMERGEAAASGLPLLSVEGLQASARAVEGDPAETKAAQWQWALEESGVEPGRIGLAGHYPAGLAAQAARTLENRGWGIEDARLLSRRLRRRKGSWEVGEIRRVAKGAVKAFRAVAAMLAEASSESRGAAGELSIEGAPLTAGRLRRRITQELTSEGLAEPEGNIVSLGPDSAVPHTQGASDRILEERRTIVVDLYPKGHLFADCTRTFCVGSPRPDVLEAHALVREALARASESALPGVSGAELQDGVCEIFESAGWPTAGGSAVAERGYVHGLGHGVGYELHELPLFRGEADSELAVGDVFTLEPGLYDPAAGFGVRLEDLFVMGREGAERLTPLPYDLDPHAW